MKSGDSYKEARRLLKKHFGDTLATGTGLQEFSFALEQARNAMTGMQYMNYLNTANVLRHLWEKLPRYVSQ